MSLKFKDFFELMTVEYSSMPDDLNESNGEVISFGKLIADTIDDAPESYREFERNLLSEKIVTRLVTKKNNIMMLMNTMSILISVTKNKPLSS